MIEDSEKQDEESLRIQCRARGLAPWNNAKNEEIRFL
jgi:hypothetical protein